MDYSIAKTYFENGCDKHLLEYASFKSIKGRCECILFFLKRLALLPFCILKKVLVTLKGLLSLLFPFILLVITLGGTRAIRDRFQKKVVQVAVDLCDWIIFPFAVAVLLLKAISGAIIHPKIFYTF